MHPFSLVSQHYRWYALAVLAVATAALAWRLSFQGQTLRTPTAPFGILSFEFCWSKSSADSILNSWKDHKGIARLQLQLDYVFIIFYPLLLSLACGMIGDAPGNGRAVIGIFLSWAILLAGLLDAVENYVLLEMLRSDGSAILAKTAGLCAGIKFTLVYAALGYIVFEGISVLIKPPLT